MYTGMDIQCIQGWIKSVYRDGYTVYLGMDIECIQGGYTVYTGLDVQSIRAWIYSVSTPNC